MKKAGTAFLFLFTLGLGQTFAQDRHLPDVDLISVFDLIDDGNQLIGYKGADGKRLKIVFTDVRRSTINGKTYQVRGKTLFDKKVAEFTGTLTLIAFNGAQDRELYTNEQGQLYYFMTGKFACKLKEGNNNQACGGLYNGVLTFYCGLDKNGVVVEDDQINVGDAESNYIFEGTWKSYHSKVVKEVQWGMGKLSSPIGHMGDDGMFYIDVADPENKLGWETYRKAFQLNKQDSVALKEEHSIWWR